MGLCNMGIIGPQPKVNATHGGKGPKKAAREEWKGGAFHSYFSTQCAAVLSSPDVAFLE